MVAQGCSPRRQALLILLACLALGGCTPPEPPVDPSDYWVDLGYVSEGSAGQSWESYYGTSIAIDPGDKRPVVAVSDGGGLHVLKWSQSVAWNDLGYPATNVYWPSLAVDPTDSKPIVGFQDFTGSARVHKWLSGRTWTDLGNPGYGLTPPYAQGLRIAIGRSDTRPFAVFEENGGGGAVGIRAYQWGSGTDWTDLGFPSPAGAMSPAVVIDPTDDRPIIAFTAANYDHIQVLKWLGGASWIDLGAPEPTGGENAALSFDIQAGKPILAARWCDPIRIDILRWSSGTAWTSLGQLLSDGDHALASDPAEGTPMVAFIDWEHGKRVRVMKWAGGVTWTNLGMPSPGEAGHPAIVVDPSDGNPLVLFTDGTNGWRARVMKYSP
jgi:hypothetical protein